MGAPVGGAVVLNGINGREWWAIVLPLFLILHCVIELLLDYVLRLNFRKTALLWPYISVYYLALMGMIGYNFLVSQIYGFVTLATYFLNLLATWYAHSKGVG